MTFVESMWIVVEVFLFVAYLLVFFQIIADLFSDPKLGGFAKAIWIVFLLIVPLITALVYIIARGRGMSERRLQGRQEAQQKTEEYIRTVAGTSPAQEIAAAKELLDSGAISPTEFEKIKASALA